MTNGTGHHTKTSAEPSDNIFACFGHWFVVLCECLQVVVGGRRVFLQKTGEVRIRLAVR